jgi:hypothetical protein
VAEIALRVAAGEPRVPIEVAAEMLVELTGTPVDALLCAARICDESLWAEVARSLVHWGHGHDNVLAAVGLKRCFSPACDWCNGERDPLLLWRGVTETAQQP